MFTEGRIQRQTAHVVKARAVRLASDNWKVIPCETVQLEKGSKMPITVIIREFATFADKIPFHTFSLFCYGEKDLENLITNITVTYSDDCRRVYTVRF